MLVANLEIDFPDSQSKMEIDHFFSIRSWKWNYWVKGGKEHLTTPLELLTAVMHGLLQERRAPKAFW